MKTLLFCIALLFGTSSLHAANNTKEQKYQLATAEFIDDTYSSKLTLTYEDNRLIKVTEGSQYNGNHGSSDRYEFDYSQLDKQIVTMKYYYENDIERIVLTLNSDGAAEKAVFDDGEWYEFYYNSDRQLNRMVRHDDDILEITEMTYDNGSLIRVNEDDGDAFYMTYTSVDTPSPIKNIAGLMYKCDILWMIDLDEFNYVYMAGLLGEAPAYLPLSTREHSKWGDDYVYHYKWELDNNGIPLTCIYNTSSETYSRIYKYSWNTVETGVNNIMTDTEVSSINAKYSINGTKIDTTQKGINIIRYSDGTTRKVISR